LLVLKLNFTFKVLFNISSSFKPRKYKYFLNLTTCLRVQYVKLCSRFPQIWENTKSFEFQISIQRKWSPLYV